MDGISLLKPLSTSYHGLVNPKARKTQEASAFRKGSSAQALTGLLGDQSHIRKTNKYANASHYKIHFGEISAI